jgi:hypothetical protein
MTTKIKVSETTEREVEITLPYFAKSNSHFYKLFDNAPYNGCIQIYTGAHPCLQEVHSGMAFRPENRECTEAEFEAAFEEVMQKLISRKNTPIENI